MTSSRAAVTTTLLAAAAGVVDQVVPAALAVGGFVLGAVLAGLAARTRAGRPGVLLAVLVGAAVAMGAREHPDAPPPR